MNYLPAKWYRKHVGCLATPQQRLEYLEKMLFTIRHYGGRYPKNKNPFAVIKDTRGDAYKIVGFVMGVFRTRPQAQKYARKLQRLHRSNTEAGARTPFVVKKTELILSTGVSVRLNRGRATSTAIFSKETL